MTLKTWALAQKYQEESLEELVTRLNTPVEIANPIPAKLVPPTVSMEAIREVVSAAEAFKVLSTPFWPLIVKALANKDLSMIQSHIEALVAGKAITAGTAESLQALFQGGIPDPDYKPTLLESPAKSAGFIPIKLQDLIEPQEVE